MAHAVAQDEPIGNNAVTLEEDIVAASDEREMDPAPEPADKTPAADNQFAALLRGRAQLEWGYSVTRERAANGGALQQVFPDMLFRLGVTDRLELRLGWPGYVQNDPASGLPSGIEAPSIGFMLDLWPQKGWIPQTAISAAVATQRQQSLLGTDSTQPLCRVLYRWQLNDRLGCGGETGLAQVRDTSGAYFQIEQILNADVSLNDTWTALAEWEMLVDQQGPMRGVDQSVLSLGLAWACTEHLVVSWRVGTGLNDRSPDLLASMRFALRF
jgi:hypothetical protein